MTAVLSDLLKNTRVLHACLIIIYNPFCLVKRFHTYSSIFQSFSYYSDVCRRSACYGHVFLKDPLKGAGP